MKLSIRKRPIDVDEAGHDKKQCLEFEAPMLTETENMYVELCKLADAMGVSLRQLNEMGMRPGHRKRSINLRLAR